MSNALINERSPYLRQHAKNPVDWLPWGEAAFEKARREDKPVFLSIGYSTCHWCHVMAEESFENKALAEILNHYYVPVKVDREERPDIDSVYMKVCTALNGSGGWPLTVIMTPEQQPFFAGTYLPRESSGGRMGLRELLLTVADKWRGSRGELTKTASELTAWLRQKTAPTAAVEFSALTKAAETQLEESYDEEYGGFGTAPKFPSAHNLIFLMEYAQLKNEKKPRQMVENTLRQMYKGGIYDHIGGGFARYSTDREWLVSHFEKTLYDNALLALAYTEAWQDGHMALWRTVAEDTLDYCLRELKASDGGFFCGQDADSGGDEGAYYLFTPDEVKQVLGDEGAHFCECYDITPEGNFRGKSIPNLLLNTRWAFLPEGYDGFCERLRIYREERMTLGTDTKILTAWNGLMLMALSRAAMAFSDRRYLMEAEELAGFMAASLPERGALMARLCEGELKYAAQLDDYAFYALGLLELYSADFDPAHILKAEELAENIRGRFADEEGGYFRTAIDAEKLLIRPKEIFDGAMPSGNSAAAALFDRLFKLTGKEVWRAAADAQRSFISCSAGQYPAGCCYALTAMLTDGTSRELVCVPPDETLPETLKAVLSRYAPELTVLVKTPANTAALSAAAPYTADMQPKDGKPAYYVCTGGSCALPVDME